MGGNWHWQRFVIRIYLHTAKFKKEKNKEIEIDKKVHNHGQYLRMCNTDQIKYVAEHCFQTISIQISLKKTRGSPDQEAQKRHYTDK